MLILGLVLIGIIMLVKSADVLVEQSSALAKKLKVNDFLIGLTVVAFGTSLPELTSSFFSAIEGHNQLLVSNIIGSNIANLCLVFGLSAMFNSFVIDKRDVNLNIPINAVAMMAFWGFAAWSGFVISWPYGISLMLVFVTLILLSKDYNHFANKGRKKYAQFKLWLMIGSLIVLIGSGRVVIENIILLAQELNLNESILGYFLLAIGTSLPELVTTWTAVKKKEGQLGMGNILGSNLFNLLFILGAASFINPVSLVDFKFELSFLSLTILAVYVLAVFGKKYSFSKREGLGLLIVYGLFGVIQIMKTWH